MVAVCKHDETAVLYEPQETFGEHLTKTVCADETCAEQIEEKTESCVDADGDHTCDLCGMTEFAEVGEKNGWEYGIAEDGSCSVIAYSGSETEVEIPEKLGGTAVTAVAPYALSESDIERLTVPKNITFRSYAAAGCESLDRLLFGEDCVLEANAFADCTGLEHINMYGGLTIDPEAFSGCESLRAGCYMEDDVFEGVELPDDFISYADGMDVGIGKLLAVDVVDGIIYGKTTDEEWVVLDFPNDRDEIEVNELVVWIVAEAVDGLSEDTEITLGSETCFAPEILNSVDWSYSDNTLSCAWIISCGFCEKINEKNGGTVVPSIALVKNVMKTAEELGKNAITDGDQEVRIASDYAKEEGVKFSTGDIDCVYYAYSDYGDSDGALDAAADYIEETLIPSFASGSEKGAYDQMALQIYLGDDGLEVACMAIIL